MCLFFVFYIKTSALHFECIPGSDEVVKKDGSKLRGNAPMSKKQTIIIPRTLYIRIRKYATSETNKYINHR